MNWQNIRDDFYTHRYFIERKLGLVCLALTNLSLVAMIAYVWNISALPNPLLLTLYIVGSAIMAGYGMAVAVLPQSPIRNEPRWRYKLDLKAENFEEIENYLTDNMTGRWEATYASIEVTRYVFARIEDMILAKLRFGHYWVPAREPFKPVEQNEPSAGPHHMAI